MREVRIKDTLTGELVALDSEAEVGIYACGPTVYSRIHIGNARPFVIFSLLARFLRSEGYDVSRTFTYVIAGAGSREEAVALARRVHGDVEPGGELVYEVQPQNPFAVFGGLGG